jgi:N-methylhydantoinase A
VSRRPFPIDALLPEVAGATLADARTGRRRLYAGGVWHDADVFARDRLPRGASIAGPAIVEQIDATTVIDPGATATVDDIGNLRIRL